MELVDASDNSAYSAVMTNGDLPDATSADADTETWAVSNEEITITAGTTTVLIVRGDLPASIGNGDKYHIDMTVDTTNLVAETVVGGDIIDNFSVSTLNGKDLTVKTAALKISSTALNTADAVISSPDVVVFKGTMQAGVASNITIERMRFEAAAANQLDTANISRAEFIVGGVVKDYITSFTTGELDFNELSVAITKGTTVNYEVQVDLKNTFSANTTLHIRLDTVTAKDSNSVTVAATDISGTAIANTAELATTSETTLRASGALSVSLVNTDIGFNKDRYVLAGGNASVAKLQLRAYFEDVIVKQLTLTNTASNTEDSVVSVNLYKEAALTNKIGSTTLGTNDLAFFDDLNYEVVKGTQNLYVQVVTAAMGDLTAETADLNDVIQFNIDDDVLVDTDVYAEGADSGVILGAGDNDSTVDAGEVVFDLANNGTYDEAGDTATANSKSFTVVGTQITAVEFVSSYSGTTVDTKISGTGTYNVGILKITNNSTTNKNSSGIVLKTALEDLRLKVEKNGTDMDLSGMTIQRIGGTIAAEALAEVDGAFTADDATGYATLSDANGSSQLSTDAEIGSGETAYYVIKAAVTTLQASLGNDWIKVSLDSLDAGDATANIVWQQNDTATDMQKLLLDYTSIDGTKINEASS